MNDNLAIQANFSTREFSVSGPREIVQEWAEKFIGIFETKASQPGVPREVTGVLSVPVEDALMPETFGEYLHNFGKDVSHNDHALIAALFAQTKSDDSSFATGDVNDLLLEQGIRLPNPSNAVKRNIDARRVFAVGSRKFRVSRSGIEYLKSIQSAGDAATS